MEDHWIELDKNRVCDYRGYTRIYRIFGLNGKLFPRISVTLYEKYPALYPESGYRISANIKYGIEGPWGECNIPAETLHVVSEMIKEIQKEK